jgi:hypothetical protein
MNIHTLRLSVGGRTHGHTENIYSIFRDKFLLLGEHVYNPNSRFYELSRGSVSCFWNASLGKQFHNATSKDFTLKLMIMVSTGAIWGEYLPDGSYQWYLG